MVTKCANVYYIYDQTDTRVARCRPYGFARRGKGSGTAQQAAPNDESWRKYEGHFNGHKIHECILYLRPIQSSGSTDRLKGALGEPGRAKHHNIKEAAPHELKLGGVA